jgi:aldehyde:ferredoxin oxidoreductase
MGIDKVPERFSMEGLGKFVSAYQDYAAILDSLVCCLFMHTSGMDYTGTLKMLNAVTGWSLSIKDLAEAGERVWNLQRLMNLRDGYSSKDDRLPKKMFEPGKNGFRAGKAIYDFDKALQEYYASRGWDKNGIPTDDKLSQLQIKF